jgi:hypothetical protein
MGLGRNRGLVQFANAIGWKNSNLGCCSDLRWEGFRNEIHRPILSRSLGVLYCNMKEIRMIKGAELINLELVKSARLYWVKII